MDAMKLARLAAFSRALSSYADLDQLVQELVDIAAELAEAEGSSLILYDEEERVLRYVAASWYEGVEERRRAVEQVAIGTNESVAGTVMDLRAPVTLEAGGDVHLVIPAVAKWMPSTVQSLAAVPLMYRQLPIGVLECINHATGQFPPDAVEALETLASLGAVAIYNAHLLHNSRQAYDELSELNRLKSDFIAITSHELRTPLGVILGHTAMLREIADRDMQEPLEAMERNALELKRITENLTAIQDINDHTGEFHLQPVCLNDVLHSCARAFAEEARKRGVALGTDLPDMDVVVRGSVENLEMVLHNLIRNALEFSADKAGRGKVLLSLKQNADQAVVSVIDNGIGISEKDLRRIFDRFYQVEDHMRRTHGGMGVGLSTAKYIVERLGGRIWVDSVEGKGSRFTFSLPVDPGGRGTSALLGGGL